MQDLPPFSLAGSYKNGCKVKKKVGSLIRTKMEGILGASDFLSADDGLFYGRVTDNVAQGISLLKTRYKDHYVVACSLSEVHGKQLKADDVTSDDIRARLSASESTFCLTPVAPFQNTYDWDLGSEERAAAAMNEIAKLIENVAMPVFSTIESPARLREAQNTSYSERTERKVVAALGRFLAAAGFQASLHGGFLWKENGDIVATIRPSIVGLGCFLIVHLILWSPVLEGERKELSEPPEDFSSVAFAKIAAQGITEDGVEALWPIADEFQYQSSLDDVVRVLMSAPMTAWLDAHCTVPSLISVVSPDLRPYVQRNIDYLSEK